MFNFILFLTLLQDLFIGFPQWREFSWKFQLYLNNEQTALRMWVRLWDIPFVYFINVFYAFMPPLKKPMPSIIIPLKFYICIIGTLSGSNFELSCFFNACLLLARPLLSIQDKRQFFPTPWSCFFHALFLVSLWRPSYRLIYLYPMLYASLGVRP